MRRVVVNGEEISLEEIRTRAGQIRREREAALGPLPFEERIAIQEEVLQLLIDRLLILQEGRRLSVTATDDEVNAMLLQIAKRTDLPESRHDIRHRIVVDKVVDSWREATRRPKISELRDYYRKNQQQFYEPETIHAAHIVCNFEDSEGEHPALSKAEGLRALVAGGAGFGQVASIHSDCPEDGGDLGWFAKEVMVKEFDNVAFTAPLHELTPIFRTEFGYHFAIVHAKKPAGVRPFDEVRSDIENVLWLMRQDHDVGHALATLRAKAVIRREA